MNDKLFPKINILHAALTMGPLLFFLMIIYLQNGLPSLPPDFSDPLVYVAIVAFIAAFAFQYMIYPTRVNKLQQETDPKQKISRWQTLFIIRCAITEGACLANIVCMLLTESVFFVYLFIPLFILQLSYFPTKNRVQSELDLSQTDAQLL